MPDFTLKGKVYHNPVELALDKIGGRWKIPILWRLQDKTWRYGALHKNLKGVTHKMLTQQLRELEEDGFLHRQVYAEVPPRVEYSLTARGREAIPVLEALRQYGITLQQQLTQDPQ